MIDVVGSYSSFVFIVSRDEIPSNPLYEGVLPDWLGKNSLN